MADVDAVPYSPPPEFLRDAALLQKALDEVERAAGFQLPIHIQSRFRLLWQHSFADHPARMDRLRPSGPGKRDWHLAFADAVLNNVQEGVAALWLHLEEVRSIESQIVARVSAAAAGLEVSTPITGAGGNSRKLDAHYQAHVLALRRTLEYFSGSVAAFFKQENPGFRHLTASLERARPTDARDHALLALERRGSIRNRILTTGNERSVRDRIAHWSTVPAGVINLQFDVDGGFRVFMAGGGEDLAMDELSLSALSDVLTSAADEVIDMMFETYEALGLMHPASDV